MYSNKRLCYEHWEYSLAENIWQHLQNFLPPQLPLKKPGFAEFCSHLLRMWHTNLHWCKLICCTFTMLEVSQSFKSAASASVSVPGSASTFAEATISTTTVLSSNNNNLSRKRAITLSSLFLRLIRISRVLKILNHPLQQTLTVIVSLLTEEDKLLSFRHTISNSHIFHRHRKFLPFNWALTITLQLVHRSTFAP